MGRFAVTVVVMVPLFRDIKVQEKAVCPSRSCSVVKLMSRSMLFSSLVKDETASFFD